jgi:DeoR/GlpR family transcriptional regulator of sugar metabolism
MFAPQRREKIMQLLHAEKQIIVKDLASTLNVSEGTLRTDLRILEEEGLLTRTHGGAMLQKSKPGLTENCFSSRSELNHEEKRAIALKAAEFVKQGQCIILDAGSTSVELAKLLTDTDYLTVVTNGLNAAMVLNHNPRINVILIGGILRPGSRTIEGTLGENILKGIHADIFFISAEGFTLEAGMTDFSISEAELKKTMASNATRIIALLDHTKLGRRSIATSVEAKSIHTLITDKQVDKEFIRKLNGIQVIVTRAK